MRSLLPLQRLFKGTAKGLGLTREQTTTFKTSVWEDNQGCHTLANMEPGRITPRSKHYAIKFHWFRSHLKPNRVEVRKIDTNEQKADILTKGLRTDKFRDIRKLLWGWWAVRSWLPWSATLARKGVRRVANEGDRQAAHDWKMNVSTRMKNEKVTVVDDDDEEINNG